MSSHLSTYNEYNSYKKRMRDLCSIVIFEIKYKSGLFNTEKIKKLRVWYTPLKIHDIDPDPTIDGTFLSPKEIPVDVDFKIGDSPSKAFSWAKSNEYEIIHIIKKRRSDQF